MIIIFKRKCVLILLLLSLTCIKNEYNDHLCKTNSNSIKKYNNNEIIHENILHETQPKKKIN